MLKQLKEFWLGPIDPIRIETFRVASGASIFLYCSFRFTNGREWLTDSGFHISAENLPYHSMSVPLLPAWVLPWFGCLLFGSLTALILGWKLRWSSWLAFFCFLYVTWADQLTAFVTNKLSVVSLLIIALTATGKNWSLSRERQDLPPVISAWPVRILQITLIANYFMAGWSKAVYGEWLIDPYVLWSQIQGTYLTDFGAFLVRIFPLWVWPVLQCNALAFELLVPVVLGVKRYRIFGLWWGLIFQTIINATMYQLIFFSLVVLSFYVVFIDEKFLKRCHSKVVKE